MFKYLKIFFLIFSSISCFSQDFTELAEDIPESTILVVDGKNRSFGSGFICTESDYIITNYHVISNMRNIYIKLYNQEKRYLCNLVNYDRYFDIAILEISYKEISLINNNIDLFSDLRLPVSLDKNSIGMSVFASGYPHGFYQFSIGNISGSVKNKDYELIQHTSAISPGNSGGPLLNDRGEVIGINTLILRGAENMGYAIPIKYAINLLPKDTPLIYLEDDQNRNNLEKVNQELEIPINNNLIKKKKKRDVDPDKEFLKDLID